MVVQTAALANLFANLGSLIGNIYIPCVVDFGKLYMCVLESGSTCALETGSCQQVRVGMCNTLMHEGFTQYEATAYLDLFPVGENAKMHLI